jgi:DNA-binding NtrC family response regulator
MSTILLAEPNPAVRVGLDRALRSQGFCVVPAGGDEAVREARERNAQMAVAGVSLAAASLIERLGEQLRQSPVWVPVLLLVSGMNEELAAAALKAGVSEYLPYPCSPFELAGAARHCLERHYRWNRSTRCVPPGKPQMIGESHAIEEVKAYLARVASTDSTIPITGETGTGKELAAEFVHRHGGRKHRGMVTVNCAAIPDTLLESELFGYERGAFTGAQTSREGKWKEADGETIFLDEIGDMSGYAQAKILRAIDSKEIQRLGGAGMAVDVRIIAATNQDLESLVREGKFRKDLYFRLNVARVHLPALRERNEDITPIVSFYLQEYNARFGRAVTRLTEEAWEQVMSYDWPGNIRELKNAIESMLIHSHGGEIGSEDLPPAVVERWAEEPGATASERKRLISALTSTNWNRSRAADKLRWSRVTLYRKMAKCEVTPPVRELAQVSQY